jgi:hypothetical protein
MIIKIWADPVLIPVPVSLESPSQSRFLVVSAGFVPAIIPIRVRK